MRPIAAPGLRTPFQGTAEESLSFINFAAREINCKIVYYGPGLGREDDQFAAHL